MKMKCSLLTLVVGCCCFSAALNAQIGFSYHHSSLPFFGVNYEFGNRWLTELRIPTNLYLEDLGLEAIVAIKIGSREEVDPYVGLGFRYDEVNLGKGLVLPLGLNAYPFTKKNLGFHLEFAPFMAEDGLVLRGTWGIRYRFGKE